MLRTALRNLRRAALVGSLAVAAGSSASAGWLCGWCAPAERPWYNPCNEPNWGFEETRWRRFPQGGMTSGMQGSYCGTGGCPVPGTTVSPSMGGMSLPAQPGHSLSMPSQSYATQPFPGQPYPSQPYVSQPHASQPYVSQPNPTLQQMIIPPQGGNANSGAMMAPQNGAVPIFSAPANSVPRSSNQFDNQIFTPHEPAIPYGTQPAEMVAPNPMSANMNGNGGTSNGNGGGGVGTPVPMPGLPGGTATPNSVLPPQLMPGGAGEIGNGGGNTTNGGANPIPQPMSSDLPPMPQAGYYQSPFHVAGHQGAVMNAPAVASPSMAYPGSTVYRGNPAYGNNSPGQNSPIQNYPTQNYPVAPQQMPTATQYPSHMMPPAQSGQPAAAQVSQPRLPFKGVSFSSDPAAAKPSRNPFRAVSRLWSRKK